MPELKLVNVCYQYKHGDRKVVLVNTRIGGLSSWARVKAGGSMARVIQ